jgi:hypothetical protein
MDRIFLLGKLQDPYRIVKVIDGSPLRIVLGTCPLDHLHPWEEVVAANIIVISGGADTGVADDPAVGVVGSITDSNFAFNRR